MAKSPLFDLATIEEYLAFEETTPDKHELHRGRIVPKGGVAYAMAGGSTNHSCIIVSLGAACTNALRGRKPCRFIGENEKLLVSGKRSGYRPDGAIACPPNVVNPRQGTYDNPTVIFEVLSPGTENLDRTDKFDDYKSVPTLREYVLIESEKVRVEVFSRLDDGRWVQSVHLPGTVAHIPSVGVDLPLDELYENAAFETTVVPQDV